MRKLLKVYLILILTIMFIVSAASIGIRNSTSPQSHSKPNGNLESSLLKLKQASKNKDINVNFITDNGNYSWGLKVRNGTATGVIGGLKNPDVIVKSDYNVAKKVMKSDQPIIQIIDELLKGNIIEFRPNSKFEKNLLDSVIDLLKFTREIARRVL